MTVTKDKATDAAAETGPGDEHAARAGHGVGDAAHAGHGVADAAEATKNVTRKATAKPLAAVTGFRDRIRRMPGGATAWRVGVTIVGLAIIVGGIILLPLPGPGWLIVFAGLGVLATEYDWAKRLLRFARHQVGRWTDWVKRQPRWIQALTGLLGLAFLAAVFYVVYLVLYA